ncbi:hypothetical protein DEO72_LG11g2414 [Vigna unguiculata]|uniref:Uncharacterized protein n=1 Tax=Vigna unguiculata TaxID=3917 RepID=A0A4D6NNI7_VIGUN|nr:hypothetical protein DEO72_LG11g2414 [Vigna unguiculata]
MTLWTSVVSLFGRVVGIAGLDVVVPVIDFAYKTRKGAMGSRLRLETSRE